MFFLQVLLDLLRKNCLNFTGINRDIMVWKSYYVLNLLAESFLKFSPLINAVKIRFNF